MSFNTKTGQFAWKHMTLILEGRPIFGLTDIEYNSKKNIEEIYGAGDTPQFLGEGNKSYEGTVEFLQNDYEALVEEARKRGGDDVTDLEVSITIAYVPKNLDQVTKTIVDRLDGVKFTETPKKMTQGNTHMKVALPFKCLRLTPQI